MRDEKDSESAITEEEKDLNSIPAVAKISTKKQHMPKRTVHVNNSRIRLKGNQDQLKI
jgi:hypothetical protein